MVPKIHAGGARSPASRCTASTMLRSATRASGRRRPSGSSGPTPGTWRAVRSGRPRSGSWRSRSPLHAELGQGRAAGPAEMNRAAEETLKALGLERHQALIVAHRDKDHPHFT